MTALAAEGLSMTYRVPVRQGGLAAAIASVVRRRYRDVEAVREVSFTVGGGEVVGLLGPNGAGKTTTMKMLSGLLHPTGGRVRVLGFTPSQRRTAFLKQIALVRGSQPIGGSQELTLGDAMRYQRVLYDIPPADYRRSLDELGELLTLAPLLGRQLRALSLGERMRAGLALSLLYRPRVLFLDEPSIGLDVTAATAIRRFLADYAVRTGATIVLTSHHLADVESLCRRLILIDHGRVGYDGPIDRLAARLSPFKVIRVVDAAGATTTLRVPRERVARAAADLLARQEVTDLTIEDPSLEQVIDRAYREGV